MISHSELQLVIEKRDLLCAKAFNDLEVLLSNQKFDRIKCNRDIHLIFDAVIYDVQYETTRHVMNTGSSYIKYHNGYTFRRQKKNVILAIDILRNLILPELNNAKLKTLVELKFDLLCTILNEPTVEEVKWWDWTAKTLPLAALSMIFFSWTYNYNELTELTIIIISVIFFIFGVIWWWWALKKIGVIYISTRRNQEKFDEIRQEIRQIKKQLNQE